MVRAPPCGVVRPVAAGCWWPAPGHRKCSSYGTGPSALRTITPARPTRRAPRSSCRSSRAPSRSRSRASRSRSGLATRPRSTATWRTPMPIPARSPRGSAWPSSRRARRRDPGRRLPVPDLGTLREFLAGGHVDAAVFALRPDYRAMLLAVDGLVPGPSDQASDALLQAAENATCDALRDQPAEQLPHVAAWRDAYRAFGAKPQRTRNSLEALLRRAASGLPRVNRLTDLYNAVSVLHQIPLGGEDLTRYAGPPRLVRAVGTEPFDTVADGIAVTEQPDPGEVVWCDDVGVTCRRWNWRQARRTQLREDTTAALFILDALDPLPDEALYAAADDLTAHLTRLGPGVQAVRRLIAAGTTPDEAGKTRPTQGGASVR